METASPQAVFRFICRFNGVRARHLQRRDLLSFVGGSQFSWGPNTIYFHGGEMPGFNSKISYDPTNKLTLIIWTNLTVSLDGQQTANTLFVKVLDHIYVVSPLR
jgi:hypothetical protein